jgi:chaperone modulatory protein CbpM
MDKYEFLARARLEADALEAWISAGWLLPDDLEGAQQFSDIDLARAHLIHDLRADIGVNDEGVGVVLDLLDQLHGLRRTLGHFLNALSAQPQELRGGFASVLQDMVVSRSGQANPEKANARPSARRT